MDATGPSDDAAFERFVIGHARIASGLVFLITNDPQVAVRIADDAWLDVYRRWQRIRHTDHVLASALAPFVARAVRVAGLADQTGREGLHLQDDVIGDVGTETSRALQAESVPEALKDLSARERALVALRWYVGIDERHLARAVRWRPARAAYATRQACRGLMFTVAPQQSFTVAPQQSFTVAPQQMASVAPQQAVGAVEGQLGRDPEVLFARQLRAELTSMTATSIVDGETTWARLRPRLSTVRQSRPPRLGRHRTLAVVAAATAAVIVVGAAVSVALHDRGADQAPTVASPLAPPRAADGLRLTGYRSITVSVPQGWKHNAVECGRATRDTVIFHDAVGLSNCPVALQERLGQLRPSSVTFSDPPSSDLVVGRLHEVAQIGRYGVFASVRIRRDGEFQRILLVPEANVQIVVRSTDPAVIDAVTRSVRLLPKGYTTVPACSRLPLADAVGLLSEAGLNVTLTQSSALSQRVATPPITHQSIASGDVVPDGTVVGIGFPSMN